MTRKKVKTFIYQKLNNKNQNSMRPLTGNEYFCTANYI